MTAHSKLGASSMERWASCPGSVAFIATLPTGDPGIYAAEGTVAHGWAEKALHGDSVEDCPFEEMRDAALEYRDEVLAVPHTALHVEQKFHLTHLHPDLFGTADCVLWDAPTRHLTVVDFKYGAGMAVDVRGNKQLRYYAVGAMLELGYKAEQVTTMIVQPRCAHPDGRVRSQTYTPMELLEFCGDILEAVKAVEAPDAPLLPGDWCRASFCPAQALCPALKARAQIEAKKVFSDAAPYDVAELAQTLAWLPILEGWITATREFAYNEAERGVVVPDWKIVAKRPVEHWRPGTTAETLAKTFGVPVADLVTEPELRSPAQVRKMVPGKNDAARAAALAPYTEKISNGHALVHSSDKRDPVQQSAAAAFSEIQE